MRARACGGNLQKPNSQNRWANAWLLTLTQCDTRCTTGTFWGVRICSSKPFLPWNQNSNHSKETDVVHVGGSILSNISHVLQHTKFPKRKCLWGAPVDLTGSREVSRTWDITTASICWWCSSQADSERRACANRSSQKFRCSRGWRWNGKGTNWSHFWPRLGWARGQDVTLRKVRPSRGCNFWRGGEWVSGSFEKKKVVPSFRGLGWESWGVFILKNAPPDSSAFNQCRTWPLTHKVILARQMIQEKTLVDKVCELAIQQEGHAKKALDSTRFALLQPTWLTVNLQKLLGDESPHPGKLDLLKCHTRAHTQRYTHYPSEETPSHEPRAKIVCAWIFFCRLLTVAIRRAWNYPTWSQFFFQPGILRSLYGDLIGRSLPRKDDLDNGYPDHGMNSILRSVFHHNILVFPGG